MKRMAIYAHFDAQNEIKPYVLHTLEGLRAHCQQIHFISTAQLAESERIKLANTCNEVILRENRGLDFSMWQQALRSVDASFWDELLLLNSSVYGPVTALQPIFEIADKEPWDFWGLTDSFDIDYHLQSYFMAFRADLLGSETFAEFWRGVLPYQSKHQVIRSYEVGLTQYFLEAGFQGGVIYPYEYLYQRHASRVRWPKNSLLHPTNTAVAYAEPLLELGMPFVKVDLLRNNPLKMDLAPVREFLARANYPDDFILPELSGTDSPGLQTFPQETCEICGFPGQILHKSRRDALADAKESWDIVRCRNARCRLLWMDPMPVEHEIDWSSIGTPLLPRGHVYQRTQKTLRMFYKRMLRRMKLRAQREDQCRCELGSASEGTAPRVLDMDCLDGERLRVFRNMGWVAEGYTDNVWMSGAMSRDGFTMFSGDLENIPLGRYQAIVLGNRIQQVQHPRQLLQACHSLLGPGGTLHLETPNASGLSHHYFGRNWQGMDVPRHRYAFNPRNLAALLEQVGFERISVSTTPVHAEVLAQESRYLQRRGCSWPCHIPFSERGGLTALAYQILVLLLHRWFPGRGDTCIATARKA